jgi:hypothetical protein
MGGDDLGHSGPHRNGVDGIDGDLTKGAKARYLRQYACNAEEIEKTSYARVVGMLEGNLRARANTHETTALRHPTRSPSGRART